MAIGAALYKSILILIKVARMTKNKMVKMKENLPGVGGNTKKEGKKGRNPKKKKSKISNI